MVSAKDSLANCLLEQSAIQFGSNAVSMCCEMSGASIEPYASRRPINQLTGHSRWRYSNPMRGLLIDMTFILTARPAQLGRTCAHGGNHCDATAEHNQIDCAQSNRLVSALGCTCRIARCCDPYLSVRSCDPAKTNCRICPIP